MSEVISGGEMYYRFFGGMAVVFAALVCAINVMAQTSTTVGSGQAQSPTITTYAGPQLPVSGTPAVAQAIDSPSALTPDRAGGFYVASSAQNRVYRVLANG